jgi:hypothetical protein
MFKKNFHLFFAALLTITFLHPVISHFSTHLTSRADGIFISWTIYTVSTFLIQGINFFQMPIFYPFTNTLTYSDPFISTAILNLPLLALTKNIVAMHNFHLLIGTVIMYLASYALAKELKYSNIASHFAATIFTFSPIHLHYLVHLQVYLLAGIPLTFYFLIKWTKTSNWYWLLLSFATFLYQVLNSPMSGFFLIFALIPTLFNQQFRTQIKNNYKLVKYYSVITLIILALIYFPFFANSANFNYVRTIRDTAHFAHSLNRFFQADLLLTYALLFIFWITKKKKNDLQKSLLNKKTLILTTLIGAILMLGPALKINEQTFKILNIPIPLPYAVLYYIIPGFQAFRASSRWIILLNFGLAYLMGNLITQSKLKLKLQYGLFGLLLFSFYFANLQNFEFYKIPTEIPKIYEILKPRSEKIVAEFPVFLWRMMPYSFLENDRLLYQSFHKKTLYNGVSGFVPPIREQEWNWLWQNFPNHQSTLYLKNQGVQLIIIHFDLYEKMHNYNFTYLETTSPSAIELKELVNNQQQLKLISCQEKKCLYALK